MQYNGASMILEINLKKLAVTYSIKIKKNGDIPLIKT
jgi:hypothetical protein